MSNQDRLLLAMETHRKEWKFYSFLIAEEIQSLRNIERMLPNPQRQVIEKHIRFLIDFNSTTTSFAADLFKLYDLQQIQIRSMQYVVDSFANNDTQFFRELISRLKGDD